MCVTAQFDVIKAVVDISGQGMGRLAFAQAMKLIDGEEITGIKVPHDVDLYVSSEDGKGWLEADADGIPQEAKNGEARLAPGRVSIFSDGVAADAPAPQMIA